MIQALIVALAYWIIYILNDSGASSFGFFRPIFTAPVVGLLVGDFKTGLILGAELEAIYMGIVGFGGSTPADATAAASICTAYVILGGMDIEAALALALPIGTVVARAEQLSTPLQAYFVPKFEKYANAGDDKKYIRLHLWYRVIVTKSLQAIVIFLAIWLGADKVQVALNYLPEFVMHGLTVAGGLLPAVGLGILCSLTLNKKQVAWLFIGFAMAAYLGLGNMAIAVFGGAAALLTFYRDTKSLTATETSNVENAIATDAQDNEKEDFFNE